MPRSRIRRGSTRDRLVNVGEFDIEGNHFCIRADEALDVVAGSPTVKGGCCRARARLCRRRAAGRLALGTRIRSRLPLAVFIGVGAGRVAADEAGA